MAGNKTFTELTTLATVDKDNDWMAVVDVSDTSASTYGTTKKANVAQFIGEKGDAATVDVGTTTTGLAGTNANVVNSGTTSDAILDFTIPRGEKGDKGDTGLTGPAGANGVDGEDAYVYIAYASDASGTGFTTTFNANLDYIAIKSTTTPITTPQASDFTGLWKNYKGIQGIQGEQGVAGTDGSSAYVYIAYASDSSGTGFTTTFDTNLDYVAIKATTTEILTPQASDFTGLWKNYKGATGAQGLQGVPGVDGTDGLDINWLGVYDAGIGYVINDAVFYNGSSYICKLASTGNLPTDTTYWDLMAQQGAAGSGSGDVSGPSSATDNAIARFDLATGKLIQNSLVTVDDNGSVNIPAGQQYLVNGSPVEGYSDEQAQDAVGTILTDTTTIDLTYTDDTPEIKADVKSASLTTSHLASGVLDTDLSSVSASDNTLPSAKATKTYVDSTKFTWRGAWATTTAYAVNDTVQQGGSGYVCVTAHTSGTFATDLSSGKWNLLVEGLPTPNLTTSTTTNLTGVITGDGSVLASKANPTGAIVGTTDTQELSSKTLTSPVLKGSIGGWISIPVTCSYASADDPTYTMYVAGNATTYLWVGMRFKCTQTTDRMFIITAVGTYDSGNNRTPITLYGGTDFDLANATISNPYYSPVKCPYGFPMSPLKWSVETTDTTSRGQSNPSANTYYNLGSLSIVIPIGVWELKYQIVAQIQSTSPTTVLSGLIALSTSTTSPSDTGLRCGIVTRGAEAAMQLVAQVGKEKVLTLASKTTYYPIFASETTLTGNVTFRNDIGTMYLTATCAYL